MEELKLRELLGSVAPKALGTLRTIAGKGAGMLGKVGSGLMRMLPAAAKIAGPAAGKGAGMLGKVGSGLMRMLPAAAKIAGPAAAIGAAGYGGWKLGGWLNDNVINPGVARLTGVEGQTLGGAIYDWMNPADTEPAPTPTRVQQHRRLMRNERVREEIEQRQPGNEPPVVNNVSDNRSTVVNNTTVMKVPVRNQEPTLSRRLDRMIA